MSTKPLSGIRVLDMSRILAGPWSAQVLADLGAEVIKIERPVTGDDTRHWGPPYLRDRDGRDTDTAAYYLAANRGKSSVTVNLASRRGQTIIRELAKVSDVLLENFKVGDLAKYQLDYASIGPINPRLIYCSITGFGQTGPYRHRAGYDLMIQGMGGMMSITGASDGPPQRAGVAVADLSAGLYATIAIQAALLERERSGLGQQIDLALLDVQAAMLAHQASSYLAGGVVPGRLGSAHPNIAPYQAFETLDGFIILAIGNDRQFATFVEIAGLTDLAGDERYVTNANRVRHRDALAEVLQKTIRKRSTSYWLTLLESRSIPSGPINNISEVFDIPQIKEREMRQTFTDADADAGAGEFDLPGSPMHFSRTPSRSDSAPPRLGQHTNATLKALLGYDEETLATLKDDGVI